jgi:hypothetical protein
MSGMHDTNVFGCIVLTSAWGPGGPGGPGGPYNEEILNSVRFLCTAGSHTVYIQKIVDFEANWKIHKIHLLDLQEFPIKIKI